MSALANGTDDASLAVTPFARALFALNAVVAWIAVAVCFAVTLWVPPDPKTVPTLLGFNTGQPVVSYVIDTASYFTVLSNVVVAAVMTWLWLRPVRRTPWTGALRLDSLVMIIVTGVVYAVVLAPTSTATGVNYFSTVLLHYVVPPLTVVVWLVAGPRGLMRFADLGRMLLIPLVWLGYTLVRGAVIDAYPYPFVDVAAKGWPTVLMNVVVIVAASLALAAVVVAVDRVLSRGRVAASAGAVTEPA